MYRHAQLAARARIDSLTVDMRALQRRLDEAERAHADALAELDRLREGVGDDPTLPRDARYVRTQRALHGLGLFGVAAVAVGLVALLTHTFAAPMLSWQGVKNLAFHLQHGDGAWGLAAAGAAVVLASPWLVLPLLGAVGLRRVRRWGWFLGVASCVLYLPTPLVPLAVYGLMVLASGRVRSLYFPR